MNELQSDSLFIAQEIIRRKRIAIEEEERIALDSVRNAYRAKLEAVRAEDILQPIVLAFLPTPKGMNGFNNTTKRFVRWLEGYDRPAPYAAAVNLRRDWYRDDELQTYIHWNTQGYFEMRSKDSMRFIQDNNLCEVYNIGNGIESNRDDTESRTETKASGTIKATSRLQGVNSSNPVSSSFGHLPMQHLKKPTSMLTMR